MAQEIELTGGPECGTIHVVVADYTPERIQVEQDHIIYFYDLDVERGVYVFGDWITDGSSADIINKSSGSGEEAEDTGIGPL